MVLITHSLPELLALGLIREAEVAPLREAGLYSTLELLEYFREQGGFNHMPGLDAQDRERMYWLAYAFERAAFDRITMDALFEPGVFKDATPFAPIRIQWERLTPVKRAFLDEWVRRTIHDFFSPEQSAFVTRYMGEVTNAEDFYNKAILHPLRPEGQVTSLNEHSPRLRRMIRIFLNYYRATQLTNDPFELLRLFARIELGVLPESEVHQCINRSHADGGFHFAKATYELVMDSPYFNYRRRFQDINRMRYVRIFNDDPYTHGNLAYLPYMTQERFEREKVDAEEFAVGGCRSVIGILKALGFTSTYRTWKLWNEDRITSNLVVELNRREDLHLPPEFYALLFNELYGTRFVRVPWPGPGKDRGGIECVVND
jgi:hypothetical protein